LITSFYGVLKGLTVVRVYAMHLTVDWDSYKTEWTEKGCIDMAACALDREIHVSWKRGSLNICT